ncbi:HtaA domain-containing protein [Microbacterium saccharophilum]|uniref:HtaA domain-containing protein n=1 Tax=Microbacterium saccharophilum TaxID=1213358 RepID=UPI001478785C
MRGGSLRWAISSSFAEYVTGPIAGGAITVSGGSTRSGGQFQFGQAAGSTYDAKTGLGTVSYAGAVRFTGHHGVLDVTIANPRSASPPPPPRRSTSPPAAPRSRSRPSTCVRPRRPSTAAPSPTRRRRRR